MLKQFELKCTLLCGKVDVATVENCIKHLRYLGLDEIWSEKLKSGH